jgi:hypothetical protein
MGQYAMSSDTKPFWTSWTLWGAVASLVGILLPNFGIDVKPEDVTSIFHSWQQIIDGILTFGGLIVVAYGRITAKQKLSLTRQ